MWQSNAFVVHSPSPVSPWGHCHGPRRGVPVLRAWRGKAFGGAGVFCGSNTKMLFFFFFVLKGIESYQQG